MRICIYFEEELWAWNFCVFLKTQRSKVLLDALIYSVQTRFVYIFILCEHMAHHDGWWVHGWLGLGPWLISFSYISRFTWYKVKKLQHWSLCSDSTAIIRGSLSGMVIFSLVQYVSHSPMLWELLSFDLGLCCWVGHHIGSAVFKTRQKKMDLLNKFKHKTIKLRINSLYVAISNYRNKRNKSSNFIP